MATGNVYSVGQVNSYIKNMFTQDYMLRRIMVRGEVSNCKYHSSGHIYFTLKDASGTLSCVMFASRVHGGLSFRMKEGDEVVATGRVDVWVKGGSYSLQCDRIERAGVGALAAQVEELKARLKEMGMFDAQYKQSIPKYIRRLGVVTAPTGAAVQDIINITTRRNPGVQILLYPALVQGEGAPVSVANGIHALDALQDFDPGNKVDVIIVGRGGGSLEDLMAFNSEVVAQAIFDCRTPVISAVGHETDTTIADYVADLRAPTPSAAAELAVFDAVTYLTEVDGYRDQMTRQIGNRITLYRHQTDGYQRSLDHLSPMSKVQNQRIRLGQMQERLANRMQTAIRDRRENLQMERQLQMQMQDVLRYYRDQLREADRLQPRMEAVLRDRREQLRMADQMQQLMDDMLRDRHYALQMCATQLDHLSPLKRLTGSYGFITQEDGRALQSVADVHSGDRMLVRMKDGRIHATVTETEREAIHG